jgi:hypothetical protein
MWNNTGDPRKKSPTWSRERLPNCISGYVSGLYWIEKNVSMEDASLNVFEQPSERAESWSLFRCRTVREDNGHWVMRGKKLLGEFKTLREAKAAATCISLHEAIPAHPDSIWAREGKPNRTDH